MTKIRNTAGVDVWVPALGASVPAGDTVDADADIAADLCRGPNFAAAKTSKKTEENG